MKHRNPKANLTPVQKERRRRFEMLVDRYQDQDEAAKELGFNTTGQVSNLVTGSRGMGGRIAQRLDEVMGKPKGVFTLALDVPWPGFLESNQKGAGAIKSGGAGFHENIYDISDYGQAGSYELHIGDIESEIRLMSIPRELLEEHGFDIENVKTVVINDDAQAPSCIKGNYVAFNVGHKPPMKNNTYYVIEIGGDLTLRKTSFRPDGTLVLKCTNPIYDEHIITPDNIRLIKVIGEFVCFLGITLP